MSVSDVSPVASFYDQLALDYHRIYPNWDARMARQGQALDAVIQTELDMSHAAVLDCSCGIGTRPSR
jgi:glycine/sarcosine N-methyltransferase